MPITLTIEAMDSHELMGHIESLAVRRGVGRFNVDEGAESAAEAEMAREDVTPVEPDDKPKRKRRTKAEIEADKAEQAKTDDGVDPDSLPEQPKEPEPAKPDSKNIESFAVPTDVDGLRNILRTIASNKSPQAAAGVLTAMQYTKVSDVPVEKYAEFAALADKAVA